VARKSADVGRPQIERVALGSVERGVEGGLEGSLDGWLENGKTALGVRSPIVPDVITSGVCG
jgi:hypothetical protein